MKPEPEFLIDWVDRGREPKCSPDPRYPDGIVVDFAKPLAEKCGTDLPYPAKRCGYYCITCTRCRGSVIVTTAGRTDDPRRVLMGCQLGVKGHG